MIKNKFNDILEFAEALDTELCDPRLYGDTPLNINDIITINYKDYRVNIDDHDGYIASDYLIEVEDGVIAVMMKTHPNCAYVLEPI